MSLLNRLVWPLCVALAFSVGVFWHGATAQEGKGKSVQKWEYVMGTSFADAKQLGEDGWELVTATGPNPTIFYFKRPK